MIDGHVHVWSDDESRYPWRPVYGASEPTVPGTADHVLATMAAHGVDAAVAVQSRAYGDDHRYLIDSVDRHPRRLIAIAALDPTSPNVNDTLGRLVDSGIRGLRLDPMGWPGPWLEDGTVQPLWDAAADLGIVVEVMTRPHQLAALAALAGHSPGMAVIVEHMARYDVDPMTTVDATLDLARLGNVYLKVSALASISNQPPPHRDLWPLIDSVVGAFGPERLMWGSDMPWIGADAYGAELDTVRSLPCLDLAGRRWVLGDTVRSVFGLS